MTQPERLQGIAWAVERDGDAAEDVDKVYFVEREARERAETLGDPWYVKAYDFTMPAPGDP